MEVILKKTKITNSILKQTLRSTEHQLKNGEILGWCLHDKIKYIVCYVSNLQELSIYPMFKEIEFGKSYAPNEGYSNVEVGYWVKVKLGGNYIPLQYSTKDENEKDKFIKTLEKAKHLAIVRGQFFI